MKCSVVGLGSMGLGMAKSLLWAGLQTTGYDLDPAALKAFEELGGRAAMSPGEAAEGAAVLVIAVVNAQQTESVLFETGGGALSLSAGSVVLSCATMAPAEARGLAARLEALGILFLDAPVSGGPVKAADGALTIMASGSPAAFERARPCLEAMGETIYELGETPGAGSAMKVVNQLLAGVHIAAASEALTFGKRMGLDVDTVYEVITGAAGNSWMFENRMPHVLAGDYAPKSAVDIFVKDLGIVSDIARSERFPVPVASAALQMFLMTSAAGMGKDDDSSVARLYAQIAGLDLPQPAPTPDLSDDDATVRRDNVA